MKHKGRVSRKGGFTLIEVTMVVAIMLVLSTLLIPQLNFLLSKAYQSRTKSNLGTLRTALSLYYSKTEGIYPFPPSAIYHNGIRQSLSKILIPEYINRIDPPLLHDGLPEFNELPMNWDNMVMDLMTKNDPPLDIWIQDGPAGWTEGVYAPFLYDNISGNIYIPNDNPPDDSSNSYFNW